MNILDAIDDPNVFGTHFRADTWDAWRSFLAALFALPMTPEQLAIFQKCTGRAAPSTTPLQEAWLCIGRRGGKSFVLAVIAVFLACFRDWREYLGPGERATIMIVAADRRQARVIMRYCRGLLKAVPMLARVIESETRESIDLSNQITIEVHTASFRSTRGYSIVAALLDELAFWHGEESTDPDTEVINAIKPSMATIPGAILLCASSPYARRGALWDAHRKHFAKDGDPILVWQSDTRTMNGSVPQALIDQHLADDPARAGAEWLAQFRTDIEAFIAREAVEACVTPGVRERPPRGTFYHGFVDPSSGSADSFTLAIGHNDISRDTIVIDALREIRPPFSPEVTVAELAELLKIYRVHQITGDRYAGVWPVEQFSKFGISYQQSAKPKSDLYVDLLPLINSRRIELLDHPKLISQLCSLERCTARGGRDSIDHPPNAHDDLANVCAGLAASALNKYGGYDVTMNWVDGDNADDPDGARAWRRMRFMQHVARYG
jgi:hypothetical protein